MPGLVHTLAHYVIRELRALGPNDVVGLECVDLTRPRRRIRRFPSLPASLGPCPAFGSRNPLESRRIPHTEGVAKPRAWA